MLKRFGIERHLEHFLTRAIHLRAEHRRQRLYLPFHVGREIVERAL